MDNSNPILIYQMGKVGSQSIKFSLEERNYKTEHLHWITSVEPKAEFPTPNAKILKSLKNKESNYNIVVLVRNAMARNLSAFFQRIRRWTSKRPEYMSVKEIQKDFINRYDINYADKWFEEELFGILGFNIYKDSFPHKEGYKIYNIEGNKILLLRLEDAEKKIEKAMMSFLGIKGVKMSSFGVYEKRNVGNDFINKYKEIKSMKFPLYFIEKNYNLNYSKHFYTKKEIENFKENWNYV